MFRINQIYYRGLKGFKSLDITVVKSRGQKYLDGDTHQNIKATYYWTPVINYSIFISLFLSFFLRV